jgi:hypothetical protein
MAQHSPVFANILRQEDLGGGSPDPPREGGIEQLNDLVGELLAAGRSDTSHPDYLPGAHAGAGLTGFSEIHLGPLEARSAPSPPRGARSGPEVNAAASGPGIRSIPKAMASPNWKGAGGLEHAAQAEFKRIFDTFGTLEYVPFSQVDEAIAKYGADRVLTLRIVAPFKEKRDSNGILIKNSMRITVAQTKEHSLGENGFSAVTRPYTIRLFVNWALQTPGATFETWDVSGAYYLGEIQPAESGGVPYFAHIPAGWELFGYGSTDSQTGRRMALRVRRAIPGLIVAGAEWEKVYTAFLISIGFTQPCVDRRVFFLAATAESPTA